MSQANIAEAVVSEDAIVKHTVISLTSMLEEDKEARAKQLARDIKIKAARLVIELYSGKTYEEILIASKDDFMYEITYLNDNEDKKENETIDILSQITFDYPYNGTWKDKIIAILKFENRVRSIKEIVTTIEMFQNDLNHDSITNIISNTINTKLTKDGTMRVYKPEYKVKGFYYGSPQWWEGDTLKPEHKPEIKPKDIWK